MRIRALVATASVLGLLAATADAGYAACTVLSFSVNDYGKDGPSRDAQNLLDKYAAKWTSEHGIKKFTMAKKDVACNMFLNFVLFDEYTCTASSNVCWEGAMPPDDGVTQTSAPLVNKAKPRTAATPAPITTGSVKPQPAAKAPPATAVAPAAKVMPSAAPQAAAPAPSEPAAAAAN